MTSLLESAEQLTAQVAAPAELAEAPTTLGPTEAIQARDENKQRAAGAEHRDTRRTPSQQLSEARQVTSLLKSAEQLTAYDPIEAIQIKDENEQHAADRDSSETRSQPLSEASQAATSAELVEVPTTLGPIEAIQAKDENEQGSADAERRDDISRTLSQRLSDARQVTALIESAAQPTAHDPTETIQINGEHKEYAADAERRDSSGTPSQSLSEASQVAAPADLAEAPTTSDPSKAFYVQDENGNRAGDAEMRGIGGSPSQAISEPSEATKLIGPPEEATTAGLTEALHSNDAEKARVAEILKSLERGAEVKRRRIGGTSGLPLSTPSEASTLGSPQELSTPNSIETFKPKDTTRDRLVKFIKALKRTANAKRRGSSETLDQPHSPTELTTRTISLQEPSTADRSEAFHSKDKDRLVEILKGLERSADPNRRGIDETQSQSSSTPTKVRTPAESPAKSSSPDLADGFHSNDADKDRVVNVLKALMKRSRGLIADAPPLQQAEETDLAMTIPGMSDPVTPDKTRVQELKSSHDREPERLAGSSGQDNVVGTDFSAPVANHFYQGSSATGQQRRAHTAFGTNQQPAPAAPTDPGAEYPSRASVDTSAAPAAQPLHDAGPRTLAPADDSAPENAGAGKYHRREGGMPPAVEAFMRRLADYESSSLHQTTDGGDAVELSARSEDLNNTDQVPLADELYVAAEEQVAAEVPTVAAAPTAVEGATAAEAQTAAEDPTAAEAPSTAEEPTAAEEPATAEVPTEAEAPIEAEAPTQAEAQTSAEDRTAAEEPATAEVPTTAEAPTRAEQPTGAEDRTAAQERTAAEQQTTAEELTAAEEPATAEVPTTAEAPTEVEAPTEAESSTGAEEPITAEEPTGGEKWTAAEEWIAAEQRTAADDAFDSVSAKPSSIPIVASEAWARPTSRSDDHRRWESVLRDSRLDDAGNAGREGLAQGELAPQAISTTDKKPSVAERDPATQPNTFERDADQDNVRSQEYGDGPLSATSETATFEDSPSERNDPDLAKAFFDVDMERAVAMARSQLGLECGAGERGL